MSADVLSLIHILHMSMRRHNPKSGCGVEATLSVIGGLWKPLIILHLMGGKLRFMAVSHTHLDVYKRQRCRCPCGSRRWS